jgi:hypothetical protein
MNVFLGWLATDAARMLFMPSSQRKLGSSDFCLRVVTVKPKALDSSFRWNDGIEGLRRRWE